MLNEVSDGRGTVRASATGVASQLLETSRITPEDLRDAQQHAEREQTELVDAVVALGLVTEVNSYTALALAAGLEIIDLPGIESSELAIRLVPERLARRHALVPVSVDNRLLTVATCLPLNADAEREISVASGRHTRMVIATRSAVLAALDRCYPKMREQALRLVAAGKTARAKPRVLLTDDEPITRMLVKLLLEKQQFEVIEATNGRDAVEIATRERPDLLLIDLNMPEMDGFEAIARLRRDMSLAMMPIVVLTGEEGPAAERRVIQLGIDDYIMKPFDPEALLARVNAVFRRLQVVAA